jgi:glycosyltransferase involved in cell wall biosynthesis
MDVFVEAAHILLPEELRAHFTIGVVRGMHSEYWEGVLKKADLIGVEVVTPGPNGPAFLANLDVAVLPSRWEGSPLVLFEALALGKPVVASAIPGIAEVIAGEDVGLLVPPDDPSALAEGIRAAMIDDDRRSRWSENARMLASRYTRDRAITRAVHIVTETPD